YFLHFCFPAGLIKNDEKPRLIRARHFEWHNLNIDLVISALERHFRPVCAGGLARFNGPTNRSPQVRHQISSRQLKQVKRRRTWSVLEKQVSAATELSDEEVLVNYDCRRRIGAKHDAIG